MSLAELENRITHLETLLGEVRSMCTGPDPELDQIQAHIHRLKALAFYHRSTGIRRSA